VVVGVDEAGRGPLAGPVVAAAVILPRSFDDPVLNDSKSLTPRQRERIFDKLSASATIAVAVVEAAVIDAINILEASRRALREAVDALPTRPDHALVDGLAVPDFPVPHTALVRGDTRSLSIAAASIIAKVTRDRLMVALDRRHPGYGFARHKGYGTAAHVAALRLLGPCHEHRRSFAPVRDTPRPCQAIDQSVK
jgi:ribonuclease HII